MPIQVTYGATGAGTASSVGLVSYFNTYNTTFGQNSHGTGYQGFSNVISGSVSYGGHSYDMADLQYAARSTYGTTSTALAFIAEAKTVAQGGTIGQLVYTYNEAPTHSLFGDLDTIKLGTGVNVDPSISAPTGTSYSLLTTQVTFSDLTSVLNEGISGGSVIDWHTGNNDVHNVIYPLIGGGTSTYTSGLETYLNSAGIVYNGTSNNERFDGFGAADTFKLGGGTDTVYYFDKTEDVIDLGGLSWFANKTELLGDINYTGGNAVLEYNTGHTVTIVGVSSGLAADDFVL